jgi:hypothetical protein
MRPDVDYSIILLGLMPDDFIRQGENAATQLVINNYKLIRVSAHAPC